MKIRELWSGNIWEQLVGLTGTNNIGDIFARLAQTPQFVTAQIVIHPPGGRVRGKTYQNVVVVRADDGDTVQLGSLSVSKEIVAAYTHYLPI